MLFRQRWTNLNSIPIFLKNHLQKEPIISARLCIVKHTVLDKAHWNKAAKPRYYTKQQMNRSNKTVSCCAVTGVALSQAVYSLFFSADLPFP